MSADPLRFREGDPQWTKMRLRCLTDLYWFAENVLGYGSLIPMTRAMHFGLCRFIERRTGNPLLDDCPNQKIEVPRETGKTSLETISRTIQLILVNPNSAHLICNEREQNAKDFLAAIQHHFENNELLGALFPEIVPDEKSDLTWNATRMNVKRTTGRVEPTVSVIGVGGTVTGMHPDRIVVDDMLSREAMENARVGDGQKMKQLNRWLHQLRPLLNSNALPFPEIVIPGTRWWFGDSYEHVEEWLGYGEEPQPFLLRVKLDDGTTQSLPVYRVGDLAVFRRSVIEDGRSIFPERWSLEDLAKRRMEDPVLFAANMMNRPTDEVTAVFKAAWVQHYDWLNPHTIQFVDGAGKKTPALTAQLDKIIYVDPGGFKRSVGGGDRARGAMVLVGTTGNGQYAILDVFSEVETFLGVIRQLVDWCIRYKPRKLKIEEVGQQAGFLELVRRELAAAKLTISLEAVTPKNKDKDQRILQLEPFFQRGMVYIGRGGQFHEFRTQLEQFPRATRKDLLDALAYAAEDWARAAGRAIQPAERQARELAAYRERRGLTYGRS